MRPSPSGKTRSALTLSASHCACTSESSWVMPSSTRSPGPISATRSPATCTDARLTRCTSALTSARSLVAQLRRRLLGIDDVEADAGAELEARGVGQARHDVDAPAEV